MADIASFGARDFVLHSFNFLTLVLASAPHYRSYYKLVDIHHVRRYFLLSRTLANVSFP